MVASLDNASLQLHGLRSIATRLDTGRCRDAAGLAVLMVLQLVESGFLGRMLSVQKRSALPFLSCVSVSRAGTGFSLQAGCWRGTKEMMQPCLIYLHAISMVAQAGGWRGLSATTSKCLVGLLSRMSHAVTCKVLTLPCPNRVE